MGNKEGLTASATFGGMSKRVGKSSLSMKLFTEAMLAASLERCRQMRIFGGKFGP